jgi:hypothetical protein
MTAHVAALHRTPQAATMKALLLAFPALAHFEPSPRIPLADRSEPCTTRPLRCPVHNAAFLHSGPFRRITLRTALGQSH